MADILIRNIPDDVVALLDEQARRAGLSRVEYVRRRVVSDATRARGTVRRSDLARLADLTRDLADPEVMRSAWS